MSRYSLTLILTAIIGCSAASSGDGAESSEQALGAATYNFGALASPGKCLDVSAGGTADGTNVQEWTCNGTSAQAWRVDDLGGGNSRLVNPQSGKCLDVSGSGTADGTNIQLWTCNGTGAQAFSIVDISGGNVVIKNASSGKCVDVNAAGTADGTNVQLWTCNQTVAQAWRPAAIGTTNPPPPVNPPPSALCADTSYAHCQATDFSKEDIFGNAKWSISTWSNANRTHSTNNVWVANGQLVMKVNGGTTPGQQTTGAEIVSTKTDFLYGSYRALAKTSAEAGTVSSPIFYYLSDTSEIDVEILSTQNPQHLVNYTIHENNLGAQTYRLYNAGFDPSADFHEYRFDWTPQGVAYYIDGKSTGVTLTGNTPYQKGSIIVNHWTLSDPGWGGGPPVHDALMYVKHFEFYYN